MYYLILIAVLTGSVTSDFCEVPSSGPGGSPVTYCQVETGQTVSTPYFSVDIPAGGWFAITQDGRRIDAQPDLSMAMLMLIITLMTPEEYHSRDFSKCSANAANTEILCESKIGVDTVLERFIVGEEHIVRIKLVERWSGPLVTVYRSAVASVAITN
jgi:hypothetical protein